MGSPDDRRVKLDYFYGAMMAALKLARRALKDEWTGLPILDELERAALLEDRHDLTTIEFLPVPGAVPAPAVAYRRDTIEEVHSQALMTNDLVELRGGFEKDQPRELRINGSVAVKLDRREFMLLHVLARERESHASLPLSKRGLGYLPVPEILARIAQALASIRGGESGELDTFWKFPDYTDVHHLIHSLRSKIKKAGGNPKLIEAGPRGTGYRLSTATGNVITSTSGDTETDPPHHGPGSATY